MRSRAILAMSSMASGGVALLAVAWLATRRLTPEELGFFFTFISFGALVQLADFGLSYASLQTAGTLAGTGRLDEIRPLASRVRRWNLAAASISGVAVTILGALTLGSSRASSGGVSWRGPWFAYMAAVFLVQLTLPGVSLREGAGKITQAWRLRLIQEWFSGAACLAALLFGGRLWSLAAFAVARATVAAAWLLLGDPMSGGRAQLSRYPLHRWMTEAWPFQWKIGLSSLSGFLIFRAFSPIVLVEKGPVAAGQFGLAIAIMNLLINVSSAWPASEKAKYATRVAAGRIRELRREFPVLLMGSTAFAIAAAAGSSLALRWARQKGFVFAAHLTDPTTTTIILATAVAHHVVICYALFLRAEGREPLLIPSVVGGLITVLAIWAAAHFGSLRSIAITNFACGLAGIPVAILLLRSRYHFHTLRE